MKTLDEVIRAMEWCTELDQSGCGACPYADDDDLRCYADDALNYLKEYRKLDSLDAVAFPEDDNPPLNWDELKQMTGKPVWIEDNLETPEDITKYWAIMWRFEKAEGDEYALLSDLYYEKSRYGKDWMAYRKERE